MAGAPRCGYEAHAPERALEEARRSREEAERAADRLRGLQRATAALSTTLSRSEIARAIAEHGLRLFGAMAGGISCLCADGRLEKLLAFGGPEQSLDEYWRPPLYPLSLEDFGRGGSWRCTHPDGRPTQPQDRPLARALATGEVVMGEEFVIFRGDGTRATMSLGAAPIRGVDGEIEGAVGMSWDMSEQKAVEEALREATRALDEANRHKDQFLAMLAHELRNPLAAIANATHVMKVRLARGQAVEEPFAILERQVKNSSRLLDDLLDVARLTHGLIQLSKERIRIDAVVTNAVDAQRALIGSRGHELTVSLPDEPLYVEGDPTRLEQVVTNLLNNAAKYTPDRGRIAVRAERAGGEVVVRVRDNGLGISRELMPRLFALFVQADSSLARTQGGLGLGLTLVHDLVAMHGGTVEAASEGPDKGSEFTVRLPLLVEPGDPVHEATQPEPPAAHVPRRILVVEDNIDAARMLREILSGAGHDVEVFHEGSSAIAAAGRFEPEIALLDIGLPGMDGYEVARRLRTELRDRAPVLVALSGYGRDEDRQRSRDVGMSVHLTKPFDPKALQLLIQDLLRPALLKPLA